MRKFERKKWLTEIMDEIGIDLTKDNLLIAPIGSGKTYYAINVLMGDQSKKYIYLCDNTNLKNQMLKEDETRSTNEDSTICKFAPNILVMTYKEFGMRLLYEPDTDILKNVSLIVADEIHSCIEYSEFNQDRDLSKAIEYLIKTYTNEGDLILDFTMGSGSTGVACLNTNRRFIGIELEEKYFNISKERLSKIS